MKYHQIVCGALLLCTLQACSSDYFRQQSPIQNKATAQDHLDQSIGSSILIDGRQHQVISTYYSALGQHCAITSADIGQKMQNTSMIETPVIATSLPMARFCYSIESEAFVRLKPLIQEQK